MVATKDLANLSQASRQEGLLTQRVEQDLSDALEEYGNAAVDSAPEPVDERPTLSFGYGIPMAGVRYYTFTNVE